MDESFALIVELVEPGSQVVAVGSFAGGLSSTMTWIDIRRASGATHRLVLREPRDGERDDHDIASEYRLLEALHGLGVAVPRPRLLDESCTIRPQTYAVLDYVTGTPATAATDPGKLVVSMAESLTRIHAVALDFGAAGAVGRSRRIDQIGDVREFIGDPAGHAFEAEPVLDVLARAWPPISANCECLLHGDFWTGNLLTVHDEVVAVIDWETAVFGDPLVDLATTRLDVLFNYGAEAMAQFTDAYLDRSPIDVSSLRLWDLVAACRPGPDLAMWASDWASFDRPDITVTTMTDALRGFVERALTGD